MPKTYQKEKETAIEAVIKGCELAKRMQGKLEALDVVNKEDLSPVTITDFSVQAIVHMCLLQAFPDASLVAEEDALLLNSPQNQMIKMKVIEQIERIFPKIQEKEIMSAIGEGGETNDRFWVLDPIDGTRGFIQREQYCIALALIENGRVVLGILGCPRFPLEKTAKGALFAAVAGQGCYCYSLDQLQHPKMIHVSEIKDPDEVIYCEPRKTSGSHLHSKAFEVAKLLGVHPRPFRLDSQVKYAHVAHGDAAIYLRIPAALNHVEKIWDHAAGAIIVEEAGGKVTDVYGNPLDFTCGKTLSNNVGIVATNGHVHDQVLKGFKSLQ